ASASRDRPAELKPTTRPPASSATNTALSFAATIRSAITRRRPTSIVASRSAPNTCSYAACQLPTCTSTIASTSPGRAGRTCTPLLSGVVGHELRNGVDLRRAEHSLEGRHHGTAVRDLTLRDGERGLELVEVRPDRPGRGGRLESVAARALRREDRLAVGAELRRRLRRSTGEARRRGDVRGDVLRVGARDEVPRHRRRGLADLVEDDVLDRALLELLGAVLGEGVVEVGADRPVRARGGKRVAAGALGLEELLP